MVAYYYSFKTALVKGSPNVVSPNTSVLIYDVLDVNRVTPVTAYSDAGLTTIVNLVTDQYGIVPDFYTDNRPDVLWKSGTFKGQWATSQSRPGLRGATGPQGPQGPQGAQGNPGLNGAGTNAEVAAYIPSSGPTRDALDARYVNEADLTPAITSAVTAATHSTLAIEGAIRQDTLRAVSVRNLWNSNAKMVYEDANQFIEPWANTTSWSAPANLQVSGGRAYANGVEAGANKAYTVTASATARLVGTITVAAAGGAAGICSFGFSKDAAGAAPTANNMRMIGVETNTGRAISWSGSDAGGNPEYLSAGALTPGVYIVTAIATANSIGFTMTDAARTVEYRKVWARTVMGQINNVVVWNTDKRLLTGCSIGPLGIKSTVGTLRPPSGIERQGPWTALGKTAGAGANTFRIVTPAGYDSRTPVPLVIYCHGLGGTHTAPWIGSAKNVETAIVGQGYIFATSDGYSTDHFGMQAAIDEYVRLYQFAQANYAISGIAIVGESMGGLVSLNLLAQRSIPGVAAWAGYYPITNLRAAYDSNATWQPWIRANYGIAADGSDFAAKTAGYDPNLAPAANFAGIPMKVWHSPADTVVAKANNVDLFAPRIAPYVPGFSVVTTSGDHGDASNFDATQQAALLAFLSSKLQ